MMSVSVKIKRPALPRFARPDWQRHTWGRLHFAHILVVAAVLIGGALRLYGLNWDQNAHYHPDERFISMVTSSLKWPDSVAQFLDPRQSPLNPYWDPVEHRERAFAYGTLPVYLTKAVASGMKAATGVNWDGYDESTLVGRALSGLLDTAAIVLVYLIGARLFGRRVGALASVFYAFTVLSIQHSHFYTTDVTLNFFVLLALYGAVQLYESGSLRAALGTGAAIGMALASKVSAAPIVLVVPVALLLRAWHQAAARGRRVTLDDVVALLPAAVGAALGALVLAFIFAPYAFLDFAALMRNVREQDAILISGDADRPFTRQFYGTLPFLYHLDQMLHWSLGVPLGLAAYGGFLVLAVLAWRDRARSAGPILILAWVVPYFLITGRSYGKFLRYMLPILPLLAICAALLLGKISTALSRFSIAKPGDLQRTPIRFIAPGLTAVVLIATGWWALAFANIYTSVHTANEASAWINENVPKTAVIAQEHWEEGIARLSGYRTPPGSLQLTSYEEDTAGKLSMYQNVLLQADTIVFFSNRLYGTVPRIQDRYPMARRFYEMLFNGDLGFELVHFSPGYASLFGVTMLEDTFTRPGLPEPEPLRGYQPTPITIQGGFADESFSAYDHPLVMVFRKTRQVVPADVDAALKPLLPAQPWNPALAAARREPVLTDAQRALDAAGGTFRELFDPDSLSNRAPALVWWLVLQALSLATLPLLWMAARPLADRGYLIARAAGIVALGWLVWFPVSLGAVAYSRTLIALVLAGLCVAGSAVAWITRSSLLSWLRAHWRLIALEEVIFTIAFVAFMLIRMGNPDLWHPARGGEKPMDFAYLLATIKSTTLPPFDPWFAGGYINYYYYGQYLVSVLIKLTGILPEVAYNLAVPTLFAMTLAGAWSLTYNLLMLHRAEAGAPASPFRFSTARLAIVGATVSALLLTTFGNIDGGLRLVRRLIAIGGAAGIPDQNVFSLPIATILTRFVGGIGKAVSSGGAALQIPTDWFWASTRIYPGSGNIQEFPFFTFLYADLHAHMIALPFTLLVLGLALGLALRARDARGWRDWLAPAPLLNVLFASVALGSLWTINSWDYPGYALAIGGAMLLGWWMSERKAADLARVLIVGAFLAALSYALYYPFQASFVQGYNGFEAHDERSPLIGFWTVHAVVLTALAGWVAMTVSDMLKARTGTSPAVAPTATFASSFSLRLRLRPDKPGTEGRPHASRWRASRLLLRHSSSMDHVLDLMAAMERGSTRAEAATPRLAAHEGAPTSGEAAPGDQASASTGGASMSLPRYAALVALGLLVGVGLKLLLDVYGPVVFIGAAAAAGMAVLTLMQRRLSTAFAFAAATLSFLLIAGVDIWTLKGDIGRMNTVFKFYMQVWVLLSIVAGMAFTLTAQRIFARRAARPAGAPVTGAPQFRWPGYAWVALSVGLVLLAGAYPVAATYAKINDRFDPTIAPTLDGMAYMSTAEYVDEVDFNGRRVQGKLRLADDQAAIGWLRANIDGSPIVLEAPAGPPPHPGLYRWGSRVAIYTGLPSLVGWDWHQRQQRLGTVKIEQRVNDALTIYTSPDAPRTRKLLADYGIALIYLGSMEKLHYPAAEGKFAALAQQGALEKIYDAQNVVIYRVKG